MPFITRKEKEKKKRYKSLSMISCAVSWVATFLELNFLLE